AHLHRGVPMDDVTIPRMVPGQRVHKPEASGYAPGSWSGDMLIAPATIPPVSSVTGMASASGARIWAAGERHGQLAGEVDRGASVTGQADAGVGIGDVAAQRDGADGLAVDVLRVRRADGDGERVVLRIRPLC